MPFLPDADQQAVLDAPGTAWLRLIGEAGSGKTTTALLRARALAAAHRSPRTLVLSPTEELAASLHGQARRIGGEVEVAAVGPWLHRQAEALVGRWGMAEEAPEAVVRAKRHPAVATVLEELSWDHDEVARSALHELFGDARRRDALEDEADGDLDPSTLDAVAAYVEVQFAELDRDEQGRPLRGMDGPIHRGTPLHDADTLDRGDAGALLALGRLLRAPRPGHTHVVVDEAQEFSPLELAAAAAAVARGGALTLAGDAGQQLDAGAWFVGWAGVDVSLGRTPSACLLGGSHRCPPGVMDVARAVRAGTVVPRADGPTVRWTTWASEAARQADVLSFDGVAVARDRRRARTLQRRLGREVVPVDALRGREVSDVLLPDLSPEGWPDDAPGRRALYVALTRARRSVWCGSAGPWTTLVA